jgi:NAD(P)-dependent dehydrogenase (short-subunit alcohol dehydrogenase family)
MPKTVVITGTATGTGKASVAKFAAEGWDVVATVRKEADLSAHKDLSGVRTLVLDMNDETCPGGFAAAAIAQHGGVDVLVINADQYLMGAVKPATVEQIYTHSQNHLFAMIALTHAFIPHFRQQRSGAIINIASLTAEQGYPHSAVCASKSAVATFSESLSLELARFGITVRAVLPGQSATRPLARTSVAKGVKAAPYQAAAEQFFKENAPSVTARVVYQAATDPDPVRVRYYCGPDPTAIRPRQADARPGRLLTRVLRIRQMTKKAVAVR